MYNIGDHTPGYCHMVFNISLPGFPPNPKNNLHKSQSPNFTMDKEIKNEPDRTNPPSPIYCLFDNLP